MRCEDQPTLEAELSADDWNKGLPNSFEDITAETSLTVRLALVNNYEQSEEIPHEECLRRAGLREFLCPSCSRLHFEIAVMEPNRVRLAAERSLFLNDYESWGKQQWCWEDLETGEVSQEFDSEEAALVAMREESLCWSRLSDLGD